jgi:hypothetical protein
MLIHVVVRSTIPPGMGYLCGDFSLQRLNNKLLERHMLFGGMLFALPVKVIWKIAQI